MRLWLLHPAVVHFPLALLLTGPVFGLASWRRPGGWQERAASWLLWLGSVFAWLAMGLGLLAQKTARHVPEAWEALADHKSAAFWSVGVFSILSLWRAWGKWPRVQLVAWILALGLLLYTAYLGGEVVFTFGMGVTS